MSAAPPPVTDAGDTSSHRQPESPPTDHADPTWSGYFLFLAQRIFLYFVLYALSIGPCYWHWYRSQFVGGSSIVAAFYLPLVVLAEWIPPFGDWLDWYVGFWVA
jgi:hypothetical protein